MPEETLSTYSDLCTQVYDLSKPTPPPDAYDFYHTYATEAIGPILEPMCGTGRFLLPLVEDGFDVHGFDASSHMLRALHEKARARNIEPRVWRGLIEDLSLSDNYGLILIPSGSFGLIVDRNKALEVLVKLCSHLSDDGVLVFEADTPQNTQAQTGVWKGSVWRRNDGKTIVASFMELPSEDNISTTIWRYELLDGTHVAKSEMEIIRVRQYDPALLTSLLKEAGFKNTALTKAFDRTIGPKAVDQVIVYECRKRG